jgi:GNAT superfamily N-acetyltransferase
MIKTDSLKILKFDSDLFHKKIALYTFTDSLQPHNLNAELKENNIDLLYVVSDTLLDKNELEKKLNCSISYIDEKIIFERKTLHSQPIEIHPEIKVNQWQGYEFNLLKALALTSGEYSRFFLDTSINQNSAEELYSIWLHKSLKYEIADEIYTLGSTKPSGLLTVSYTDNIANVGLLAVNESCRGQGAGRKLLEGLIGNCLKRGVNVISIPTQRINKSACKFYTKVGFQEVQSTYIYHCWRNRG